MKITIQDKEYELRYSMRMLINYENIIGKSLQAEDLQKYSNIIALFYSCIHATVTYNGDQLNIEYDKFLDWIDDNGGDELLVQFMNWLADRNKANQSVSPKKKEEGVKEDTKKSRKKS